MFDSRTLEESNGPSPIEKVEPEQVYIPPVLRAPDDYIEPRIGPGYQAVIPDIIPLGKLVPQPLYKEPAVCLHAGAAQRSSRAAPALQQITNHLFTKFGVFQSQSRKIFRGGRVETTPRGPGPEIILAVVNSLGDDLEAIKLCLPLALQFADTCDLSLRKKQWEKIVSIGKTLGEARYRRIAPQGLRILMSSSQENSDIEPRAIGTPSAVDDGSQLYLRPSPDASTDARRKLTLVIRPNSPSPIAAHSQSTHTSLQTGPSASGASNSAGEAVPARISLISSDTPSPIRSSPLGDINARANSNTASVSSAVARGNLHVGHNRDGNVDARLETTSADSTSPVSSEDFLDAAEIADNSDNASTDSLIASSPANERNGEIEVKQVRTETRSESRTEQTTEVHVENDPHSRSDTKTVVKQETKTVSKLLEVRTTTTTAHSYAPSIPHAGPLFAASSALPRLSTTQHLAFPMAGSPGITASSAFSLAPTMESLQKYEPKEVVTTLYLIAVKQVCDAFREAIKLGYLEREAQVLAQAKSDSTTNNATNASETPIEPRSHIVDHLMVFPPHPTREKVMRARELPWSEEETARFVFGLARHGKAFHCIAKGLQNRTSQSCTGYYYGAWRRHPTYQDYQRWRSRLGSSGRLEREISRRDRAWFHFWRFDDEAIGPALPPSQVSLHPAFFMTPTRQESWTEPWSDEYLAACKQSDPELYKTLCAMQARNQKATEVLNYNLRHKFLVELFGSDDNKKQTTTGKDSTEDPSSVLSILPKNAPKPWLSVRLDQSGRVALPVLVHSPEIYVTPDGGALPSEISSPANTSGSSPTPPSSRHTPKPSELDIFLAQIEAYGRGSIRRLLSFCTCPISVSNSSISASASSALADVPPFLPPTSNPDLLALLRLVLYSPIATEAQIRKLRATCAHCGMFPNPFSPGAYRRLLSMPSFSYNAIKLSIALTWLVPGSKSEGQCLSRLKQEIGQYIHVGPGSDAQRLHSAVQDAFLLVKQAFDKQAKPPLLMDNAVVTPGTDLQLAVDDINNNEKLSLMDVDPVVADKGKKPNSKRLVSTDSNDSSASSQSSTDSTLSAISTQEDASPMASPETIAEPLNLLRSTNTVRLHEPAALAAFYGAKDLPLPSPTSASADGMDVDSATTAQGAPGIGCSVPGLTPGSSPLPDTDPLLLPHVYTSNWTEERIIDNESYCCICGDGGDLACCDGPCRRSFHMSCLKESHFEVRQTLLTTPALFDNQKFKALLDTDKDDWRCFTCITGIADCFICGEMGQEHVDLFRCAKLCGKLYHLHCLLKNPLTEFLPSRLGNATVRIEDFVEAYKRGNNIFFPNPSTMNTAVNPVALGVGNKEEMIPNRELRAPVTVRNLRQHLQTNFIETLSSTLQPLEVVGSTTMPPITEHSLENQLPTKIEDGALKKDEAGASETPSIATIAVAMPAIKNEAERMDVDPDENESSTEVGLVLLNKESARAINEDKAKTQKVSEDFKEPSLDKTIELSISKPTVSGTNAPITDVPPELLEAAFAHFDIAPRFVCPFHVCSTCHEPFHSFLPPLYYRCHACPTSYHLPCVPRHSQKDIHEIITCCNIKAHSEKKLSELYRRKSGLNNAKNKTEQVLSAVQKRVLNISSGHGHAHGHGDKRARIGTGVTAKLGRSGTSSTDSSQPNSRSNSPLSKSPVPSGTTSSPAGKSATSRTASAGATAATSNEQPYLPHSRPPTSGFQALLHGWIPLGPGQATSALDNLRISHFDALDATYYDEIKKRTNQLIQHGFLEKKRQEKTLPTLNAMTPVDYHGVKTLSGPVRRYAATVQFANRRRQVGTFERPLDAAVAFDYAMSYLYGTSDGLNFPGSPSDCTRTAPLDPWPPTATSDRSTKKKPLPEWVPVKGEEGLIWMVSPSPGVSCFVHGINIRESWITAKNKGKPRQLVPTATCIPRMKQSVLRRDFPALYNAWRKKQSAAQKSEPTASSDASSISDDGVDSLSDTTPPSSPRQGFTTSLALMQFAATTSGTVFASKDDPRSQIVTQFGFRQDFASGAVSFGTFRREFLIPDPPAHMGAVRPLTAPSRHELRRQSVTGLGILEYGAATTEQPFPNLPQVPQPQQSSATVDLDWDRQLQQLKDAATAAMTNARSSNNTPSTPVLPLPPATSMVGSGGIRGFGQDRAREITAEHGVNNSILPIATSANPLALAHGFLQAVQNQVALFQQSSLIAKSPLSTPVPDMNLLARPAVHIVTASPSSSSKSRRKPSNEPYLPRSTYYGVYAARSWEGMQEAWQVRDKSRLLPEIYKTEVDAAIAYDKLLNAEKRQGAYPNFLVNPATGAPDPTKRSRVCIRTSEGAVTFFVPPAIMPTLCDPNYRKATLDEDGKVYWEGESTPDTNVPPETVEKYKRIWAQDEVRQARLSDKNLNDLVKLGYSPTISIKTLLETITNSERLKRARYLQKDIAILPPQTQKVVLYYLQRAEEIERFCSVASDGAGTGNVPGTSPGDSSESTSPLPSTRLLTSKRSSEASASDVETDNISPGVPRYPRRGQFLPKKSTNTHDSDTSDVEVVDTVHEESSGSTTSSTTTSTARSSPVVQPDRSIAGQKRATICLPPSFLCNHRDSVINESNAVTGSGVQGQSSDLVTAPLLSQGSPSVRVEYDERFDPLHPNGAILDEAHYYALLQTYSMRHSNSKERFLTDLWSIKQCAIQTISKDPALAERDEGIKGLLSEADIVRVRMQSLFDRLHANEMCEHSPHTSQALNLHYAEVIGLAHPVIYHLANIHNAHAYGKSPETLVSSSPTTAPTSFLNPVLPVIDKTSSSASPFPNNLSDVTPSVRSSWEYLRSIAVRKAVADERLGDRSPLRRILHLLEWGRVLVKQHQHLQVVLTRMVVQTPNLPDVRVYETLHDVPFDLILSLLQNYYHSRMNKPTEVQENDLRIVYQPKAGNAKDGIRGFIVASDGIIDGCFGDKQILKGQKLDLLKELNVTLPQPGTKSFADSFAPRIYKDSGAFFRNQTTTLEHFPGKEYKFIFSHTSKSEFDGPSLVPYDTRLKSCDVLVPGYLYLHVPMLEKYDAVTVPMWNAAARSSDDASSPSSSSSFPLPTESTTQSRPSRALRRDSQAHEDGAGQASRRNVPKEPFPTVLSPACRSFWRALFVAACAPDVAYVIASKKTGLYMVFAPGPAAPALQKKPAIPRHRETPNVMLTSDAEGDMESSSSASDSDFGRRDKKRKGISTRRRKNSLSSQHSDTESETEKLHTKKESAKRVTKRQSAASHGDKSDFPEFPTPLYPFQLTPWVAVLSLGTPDPAVNHSFDPTFHRASTVHPTDASIPLWLPFPGYKAAYCDLDVTRPLATQREYIITAEPCMLRKNESLPEDQGCKHSHSGDEVLMDGNEQQLQAAKDERTEMPGIVYKLYASEMSSESGQWNSFSPTSRVLKYLHDSAATQVYYPFLLLYYLTSKARLATRTVLQNFAGRDAQPSPPLTQQVPRTYQHSTLVPLSGSSTQFAPNSGTPWRPQSNRSYLIAKDDIQRWNDELMECLTNPRRPGKVLILIRLLTMIVAHHGLVMWYFRQGTMRERELLFLTMFKLVEAELQHRIDNDAKVPLDADTKKLPVVLTSTELSFIPSYASVTQLNNAAVSFYQTVDQFIKMTTTTNVNLCHLFDDVIGFHFQHPQPSPSIEYLHAKVNNFKKAHDDYPGDKQFIDSSTRSGDYKTAMNALMQRHLLGLPALSSTAQNPESRHIAIKRIIKDPPVILQVVSSSNRAPELRVLSGTQRATLQQTLETLPTDLPPPRRVFLSARDFHSADWEPNPPSISSESGKSYDALVLGRPVSHENQYALCRHEACQIVLKGLDESLDHPVPAVYEPKYAEWIVTDMTGRFAAKRKLLTEHEKDLSGHYCSSACRICRSTDNSPQPKSSSPPQELFSEVIQTPKVHDAPKEGGNKSVEVKSPPHSHEHVKDSAHVEAAKDGERKRPLQPSSDEPAKLRAIHKVAVTKQEVSQIYLAALVDIRIQHPEFQKLLVARLSFALGYTIRAAETFRSKIKGIVDEIKASSTAHQKNESSNASSGTLYRCPHKHCAASPNNTTFSHQSASIVAIHALADPHSCCEKHLEESCIFHGHLASFVDRRT